jgi:hypothetical protein
MSNLTPVTDTALLAQLNGNLSPVIDPQILAQLNAGHPQSIDAYNPAMGGGAPDTLRPFGLDTGIPLPSPVSNYLASAGKATSDLITGIGQATGLGSTTKEQVMNQKLLDAPLMKTVAGQAGNLTGNLVNTLPVMAIPGANTYRGAALIGAGLGASQPTTGDWTERAVNTGLGGAGGVIGQGAGNLVGGMIKPVSNTLNPEEQRLAQLALDNGIPLSAAQQTGSKGLQLLESAMGNMPLTAGEQKANQLAQRLAWQKNMVLGPSGVSGDLATGPALAEAKNRIGSQIGDYSKNFGLDFGQGLGDKLDSIALDAQSHLPPAQANGVLGTINQMKGQLASVANPENPSVMPGSAYQGWREPLRQMSKSGDANSMYYGQIKSAMDNAFSDQLPQTADAQALQVLRGQYANLKTLIPSMSGNSVTTEGGMVTPSLLGNKLSQAVGSGNKALGKGGLNDAVSVGNLFIGDKLPDSGTAQRSAMINLLQNAGGGAITGYGAGHFLAGDQPEGEHSALPVELAAAGALGGAGRLIAPKLMQSFMNSKPVQKYIVHQSTSTGAQMAKQLAQRAGLQLGLGGAQTLIAR